MFLWLPKMHKMCVSLRPINSIISVCSPSVVRDCYLIFLSLCDPLVLNLRDVIRRLEKAVTDVFFFLYRLMKNPFLRISIYWGGCFVDCLMQIFWPDVQR